MLSESATPSEGSVPLPISSIRTKDSLEATSRISRSREMCPLKVDRLCSRDFSRQNKKVQFWRERKKQDNEEGKEISNGLN